MIIKEALAFDDVLLVPQYSDILTRKDVSLQADLGWEAKLEIPVIASPMDSVCEPRMAVAMARSGGIGIIHRYASPKQRIEWAEVIRKVTPDINYGMAISTKDDFVLLDMLVQSGCTMFCVDVAHGYHQQVGQFVNKLKQEFPLVHVMAGNVATARGFKYLEEAGADSIRVGIGGGSVCTTRIVTGHGIPTLQSILDVEHWYPREERHAKIIADGGIRNSGDMVKALAAGADAVMVGRILADTYEAPERGFRGMASSDAQDDWRGFHSTPEGVSVPESTRTLRYVKDVVEELAGGMRSGLSYSGARSIPELQERAQWIKQTVAGIRESRPHALES